MSAYLSRLVQRFSPPASDDGSAGLQPFVRSRSPIATIDQRLGISESLGHGLGDLGGGVDDGLMREAEAPEAAQVQRKLAGPAVAAPPLAAAPPTASTSAANLSAPARPAVGPGPVSVDRTPPPAALGPSPEPFEPGRSFEPLARGREVEREDDREVGESITSPTATPLRPNMPEPELRIIERFVGPGQSSQTRKSTPKPEAGRSALAPPPAHESAFASTRVVPAPLDLAAPGPWVALERSDLVPPPSVTADPSAPTLSPRPAPSPRLEPRLVPLVVEPRQAAPAPFVPEPGEAPAPAQPAAAAAPARPEQPKPRPDAAPAAQPLPKPVNGRLDIESISQIGPLARHFPNRRRFRLRYR